MFCANLSPLICLNYDCFLAKPNLIKLSHQNGKLSQIPAKSQIF
ncbi:hypothetical protein PPIS_b0027 [Pseudoalteromonas piscicida]|uniref:Uncharacterized protein n=1 Tax=Pseudoalteromonas piscicida TaxID=43662 RepID=A0ABN5CKI0_PSEO7|nr:hypothetical protein PPIS_b0027 [Pseudoalteromonas piscicida]